MTCTNPQHPAMLSREMIFLQEKDRCFVFGCQACKDVNRKLSIRVVTDPRYRREVRKTLAREGKLMTEAPKVTQPQMRNRPNLEWNGRKSKDGRFELIHYQNLGEGNLQLQMAIDGRLAPMMDDHLAGKEGHSESQYLTRVAHASELMLHLYGDPRNPLSPEESEQRQQETF